MTTDWGARITSTVESESSQHDFEWRFVLASGQWLEQLGNGDVAVVRPDTDPVNEEDDIPEDEVLASDDGLGDEPGTVVDDSDVDPIGTEPEIPSDPTPLEAPDPATEPYDNPTFPEPEYDPAPGYAIPSSVETEEDTLANAQELASGEVVAVVSAPAATDATGNAVAATYTVSSSVVVLSVNPGTAYPISVTGNVIVNDDLSSDDVAAAAAPNCNNDYARLNTWNPHGWGILGDKFATYPVTCSRYYITISPQKDDANAPHPALKGRRWKPHIRSAGRVHALNARPRVQAVDAKFLAVAELNWGQWLFSTPNPPVAPVEAGRIFRHWMDLYGYDHWAINELPRRTRWDPVYRKRARLLMKGLYEGESGSATRRGIPYMVAHGQRAANLGVYKNNMKRFTAADPDAPDFWNDMRARTLFWSQETYTDCARTCEPGKSVNEKAAAANAYIEHHPRLAFASDAPMSVVAAREYFRGGYFSLANGFWRSSAFRTQNMPLKRMKRLVSLQAYATRVWARAHPYPGRRFGYAWNETAGITSGMTEEEKEAQRRKIRALAQRLARALQGGYRPGALPRFACSPNGVRSPGCDPSQADAIITTSWNIFRTWN